MNPPSLDHLLALPPLEAHALLAGHLDGAFAGTRSEDARTRREACRQWDTASDLFFDWADAIADDRRHASNRELHRAVEATLEHLHGIDGCAVRQAIIDRQLEHLGAA